MFDLHSYLISETLRRISDNHKSRDETKQTAQRRSVASKQENDKQGHEGPDQH